MNQTPVKFAPLEKRILANIFDNILVSLLTFFIMLTATFALFEDMSISVLTAFFTNPVTEPGTLGSYNVDFGQLFFLYYFPLLFIFFSFVYTQTLLSSHHQSTFGMRLFHLRLECVGGARPSFMRVFAKNILFNFFRLIYVAVISFFTILLHHKRQSIDDMICKTVVTDNSAHAKNK